MAASSRTALYLQASITVSLLAGSTAPSPLYAIYRSQWGFTPTMMTVIFGVYALAVLAALLVAGRLSDHVGRRPVQLSALAVQIATMALFAQASSLGDLLVARVLQGLSAGAAIAAVGAGMLDIDKTRGMIANSLAPPIGTAAGAVLSGIFVQYLPHPTQLVYVVMAAVFLVQGVVVYLMPETHAPRPGALASLRPHLRLPPAIRESLVLAAPALVATWALAGFYASLGPSLMRDMLGSSTFVASLSLFVLAASAALATLAMRNMPTATLARIGAISLAAGVAGVIASSSLHSTPLFLAATAVAGAGFGAGFQGALRSVVANLLAHERAGAMSIALVMSYLAMGLPAIAAGYLVTRQGDLVATAREFGALVIVLALVSLSATFSKRAYA